MWIVLHGVAGYLAADLLAGFWHWAEDRYFRCHWPIIGPYIAAPNELHHTDQTAFLAGSYWHRNWTTILPCVVGLAVSLLMHAPLWVIVMWVAASQANQIHAWSHTRSKYRLVRGLQEFGVLQSPRHHAIHHRSPFDCHYCVMTDWLNPVLDGLRFWLAIEWCLAQLGATVKEPTSSVGPK